MTHIEAEKQGPVAWKNVLPGGRMTVEWESARVDDYNRGWNDYRKAAKDALEKLYTTPPAAQRQWVGLTEQEWERLFELYGDDPDILIRETEAKLREKNGGQA